MPVLNSVRLAQEEECMILIKNFVSALQPTTGMMSNALSVSCQNISTIRINNASSALLVWFLIWTLKYVLSALLINLISMVRSVLHVFLHNIGTRILESVFPVLMVESIMKLRVNVSVKPRSSGQDTAALNAISRNTLIRKVKNAWTVLSMKSMISAFKDADRAQPMLQFSMAANVQNAPKISTMIRTTSYVNIVLEDKLWTA